MTERQKFWVLLLLLILSLGLLAILNGRANTGLL